MQGNNANEPIWQIESEHVNEKLESYLENFWRKNCTCTVLSGNDV